jgi:hypothetical protein
MSVGIGALLGQLPPLNAHHDQRCGPRRPLWAQRRTAFFAANQGLCLWVPAQGRDDGCYRSIFSTRYASTCALSRSSDAVGAAGSTRYFFSESHEITFRSIAGEWWMTSA